MGQLTNGIITILAAVIGVAILSVIVSKNANTAGVIQAGSSGFSQILGAAEAPVTGSSGMSLPTNFGINSGTGF